MSASPPPAPSLLARFGRRNVAYLAFVALLVPLGYWLDGQGRRGADSISAVIFALLAFVLVSGGFFVVNAIDALVALHRGYSPEKAAIGCGLVIGVTALAVFLSGVRFL